MEIYENYRKSGSFMFIFIVRQGRNPEARWRSQTELVHRDRFIKVAFGLYWSILIVRTSRSLLGQVYKIIKIHWKN